VIIKDMVPYKVLLPERLWVEARDKEHFKQLLAAYMRRYPHYIVKAVDNRMAVCERRA
jgi:hypothetical protein